ncbi:MAG: DNA-binding response regulator, partial [Mesorhizobium sp.]
MYLICPAKAPSRPKKGQLMREPLEMATIALVDDDRNILTSVSIALE